ncbi:hypothetical protein EGT33_28785 [Burkholderia multivorans]|nr:hypothetical protein EGT33_28785 [Burkholderia multivorans]
MQLNDLSDNRSAIIAINTGTQHFIDQIATEFMSQILLSRLQRSECPIHKISQGMSFHYNTIKRSESESMFMKCMH